jgi:hypothetical protein
MGRIVLLLFKEKNDKNISFIAAYIAVQKGSNIGVESLYAQQVMVDEHHSLKLNSTYGHQEFLSQKDAIKPLNQLITELQQQNHAVVLMLDANQSYDNCFSGDTLKPYSIEWLRTQRGMPDPFVQKTGSKPNSTTLTPNRDIDFIYTFGVNITSISALPMNTPAHSNHLGIAFDIDMESFFSLRYSAIAESSPRMLTSGNKKSIDAYLHYVMKQIEEHKLSD